MSREKKIRVAFLKSCFRTAGGLEKYCLKVAERLRLEGCHVDILSSVDNPEAGVVRVCSLKKPSFVHAFFFNRACKKHLLRHSYDVVVGFDRHTVPVTVYRAGNGCHKAYLKRRFRESPLWKKCLLFLNPLHLWTLYSEKYTFEKNPPKALICNSHMVATEILKEYPKSPAKNIVVIHNGVEYKSFSKLFQERTIRRKGDFIRILFVGNEWHRKGLDIALKALSGLQEDHWRLTVIGKERKVEFFSDMVKTLGLEKKVTLIPRQEDAKVFLKTHDIMLIPSRYDPFANVTVEALAMGLCVVTSTANGGSEVIAEGVNGFVVPESCSAKTLSEAIRKAFAFIEQEGTVEKIRKTAELYDFHYALASYAQVIKAPPKHSES